MKTALKKRALWSDSNLSPVFGSGDRLTRKGLKIGKLRLLMKENKVLKIRNNIMIKYVQGCIIDIQDYYIFIKYNAF